MSTDYYSLPRLIYFRNEDADISFTAFREALNAFFPAHFEVEEEWVDYSSAAYQAPDRDNQFIGGWTRSVYFGANLRNGNRIALKYYDEESEDSSFKSSSLFGFNAFSFYFVQGSNWEWVKECWQKMNAFMATQQFRDATFSFSFGTSMYPYFRDRNDQQAVAEIVQITTEEIRQSLHAEGKTQIEIQHKPFVAVNDLLADCPHPERITSIQLNHNHLQQWPEALFRFPNLRYLYIYHNPIEYSDPRMGLFTQLRELNIHSTPLSKNPSEMAELRSLLPPDCRIIAF